MYVITKNPNAVKEISAKLAELGVSRLINAQCFKRVVLYGNHVC